MRKIILIIFVFFTLIIVLAHFRSNRFGDFEDIALSVAWLSFIIVAITTLINGAELAFSSEEQWNEKLAEKQRINLETANRPNKIWETVEQVKSLATENFLLDAGMLIVIFVAIILIKK